MIESLVRVLGAVALVFVGLGVVGASIAISGSFVASGVVARKRSRSTQPADSSVVVDRSTLRPVATGAAVLLVGQVIINNGDVVLSKAFFDPRSQGSMPSPLSSAAACSSSPGRSCMPCSRLRRARASAMKSGGRSVHQAIALIVGLGLAGVLAVARCAVGYSPTGSRTATMREATTRGGTERPIPDSDAAHQGEQHGRVSSS